MIKRGLVVLVVFLFCMGHAQRKLSGKIDSISQSQWKKTSVDLDSLDNPTFIPFVKKFKDTIYVKRKAFQFGISEAEDPVTPFNFINDKTNEKKRFFYGQNTLTFNQASFANWISGGNDNIGIIGKINYNLIYKKNRHYLENIFLLGYGLVSNSGQYMRKSEDYINISSNYGYELSKDYYFSAGYQFITQLTRGYNYSSNEKPKIENLISQFMAPGYLNLGMGLSYNPNQNLQLIFRPINGQFTFVLDSLLQKEGKYGLERDGQNMRAELGARFNIIYRINITKNINYTNQLNLFSNYLSHFERVDINYSGELKMKFNKYITTTVFIDLIYDHDQIPGLQRKQTLGVGLMYNFGSESNKKTNSKLIKIK